MDEQKENENKGSHDRLEDQSNTIPQQPLILQQPLITSDESYLTSCQIYSSPNSFSTSIRSFELKSFSDTSQYAAQRPLFSNDEEDDNVFPYHIKVTEAERDNYTGRSNFHRSEFQGQHIRSNNSIFRSNEPLLNASDSSFMQSLFQRLQFFAQHKYQQLRCWIFSCRQMWEDSYLSSPLRNWNCIRENHNREKFLRIGFVVWALSLLMILIAILLKLYKINLALPSSSNDVSHEVSVVGNFPLSLSERTRHIMPVSFATKGLLKKSSNFVDLYVDPLNSQKLLLGINMTILKHPEKNMMLLSSLFRRGSLNLNPAPMAFTPASENIVIIFTLSPDSRSIEVNQVPEGLRAKSCVYRSQINYNNWTGSLTSLPVVGRTDDQFIVEGFGLLISTRVADTYDVKYNSVRLVKSHTHVENLYFELTCSVQANSKTDPLSLTLMLTRLPKIGMAARQADRRVGYFTSAYVQIGPAETNANYDTEQEMRQRDERNRINRQSLTMIEKGCEELPCMSVDPTLASMGEVEKTVSENHSSKIRPCQATTRQQLLSSGDGKLFDAWDQRKRIIHRRRIEGTGENSVLYYIDPTVPRYWWPSIVAGVEEWNIAFTRLGYSNRTVKAITMNNKEDWPDDYSIGDIRFNTISMVADPSNTMAMGPSIVDPRSGEILSSNIVFTSSWMRTWLKKFEMWGSGLNLCYHNDEEKSNYRDRIPTSVNSFESISQERSLGDFAEHLLLGSTVSETTREWDELSDGEIIKRIFGRSVTKKKYRFRKVMQPYEETVDINTDSMDETLVTDISSIGLHLLAGTLKITDHSVTRELSVTGRLHLNTSEEDNSHDCSRLALLLKNLIESGMKSITMHEVGHTLGLRHNFRASSAFPFDKRTDENYINQNGLSSSVMDYLEFNLPLSFFQNENQQLNQSPPELVRISKNSTESLLDQLLQHHFFTPTLGSYDYAVIGYGYSNVKDRKGLSLNYYTSVADENPGFGTDEDGVAGIDSDPKNNLFDLSDPLYYSFEQLHIVRILQLQLRKRLKLYQLDSDQYTTYQHQLIKHILKSCITIIKSLGGMEISKSSTLLNGPLKAESNDRQWDALKTIIEVIEDDNIEQPECQPLSTLTKPNIDSSLFPPINALQFMTNPQSDDLDPILSGLDYSYYLQEFQSLLTPIIILKKTLILSIFLPSRLSRVHHISLSKQFQNYDKNNFTSTLSISNLFESIGVAVINHYFHSSRWDLQRFWITLLLYLKDSKQSEVKIVQQKDISTTVLIAPYIASAALNELYRVKQKVNDAIQLYESTDALWQSNCAREIFQFLLLLKHDLYDVTHIQNHRAL